MKWKPFKDPGLKTCSNMKNLKSPKQPSDVLILRGLSAEINEKMIYDFLEASGHTPEYVRIIKDKSTKASKGICLVKFDSLQESTAFLENHPTIELAESTLWAEFGFEHTEEDWTCKNCKNINFSHREACFKCKSVRIDRSISAENSGNDDISSDPTRFVLLRNLDSDLNAQRIFERINITHANLIRTWLLIDKTTKSSKCFAFLEFKDVGSSASFINRQKDLNVPLKLETCEINVSFGRDLSLLSQSISGSLIGKIIYWDNNYEFCEYPKYEVSIPSIPSAQNDESSVPAKRSVFGAFPVLGPTAPSKKLQLQLKKWTDKINSIAEVGTGIETSGKFGLVQASASHKFIDMTFLCCNLCNEKFELESDLFEHIRSSDLHSQNFEEYWRNCADNIDSTDEYVDRAAERREIYGVTAEDVKRIAKESESKAFKSSGTGIKESSNQQEIKIDDDSSIGAKLLKKMGWKEGTGLGKDSHGIVEPVKATTTEKVRAGIGASDIISSDDIKPKTKKYSDIVKDNQIKRFFEK